MEGGLSQIRSHIRTYLFYNFSLLFHTNLLTLDLQLTFHLWKCIDKMLPNWYIYCSNNAMATYLCIIKLTINSAKFAYVPVIYI